MTELAKLLWYVWIYNVFSESSDYYINDIQNYEMLAYWEILSTLTCRWSSSAKLTVQLEFTASSRHLRVNFYCKCSADSEKCSGIIILESQFCAALATWDLKSSLWVSVAIGSRNLEPNRNRQKFLWTGSKSHFYQK